MMVSQPFAAVQRVEATQYVPRTPRISQKRWVDSKKMADEWMSSQLAGRENQAQIVTHAYAHAHQAPDPHSQMVELDVGSVTHNRRTFLIHKLLLCTRVPYFSQLLQHHATETPTNSLRLPHQEPISFALFIDWLYNAHYACINPAHGKIAYTIRLRLYCLATDFQLPDFMDYTINVLLCNHVKYGWSPVLEDAVAVYMDTRPGSKLRVLISRLLALRFVKMKMVVGADEIFLTMGKLRRLMKVDHGDLWRDVWDWLNRLEAERMRFSSDYLGVV
ncbi:hypothetical protein SBOR_2803 [Sclerotinia borealis F-4128]|uniref:BTB domain-containing protein n=1 Tax=Sclerotinia borealis (strain F-4128) TaxID=1432307 RepID=W9CJ97_SCLBF|nr:hypothetical protein SBOR_2803 [Sclerotinia borealis F-4128]